MKTVHTLVSINGVKTHASQKSMVGKALVCPVCQRPCSRSDMGFSSHLRSHKELSHEESLAIRKEMIGSRPGHFAVLRSSR